MNYHNIATHVINKICPRKSGQATVGCIVFFIYEFYTYLDKFQEYIY